MDLYMSQQNRLNWTKKKKSSNFNKRHGITKIRFFFHFWVHKISFFASPVKGTLSYLFNFVFKLLKILLSLETYIFLITHGKFYS